MTFDSDRLSHAYITTDSVTERLAMAVVCSCRGGERPCNNCGHCDKAARQIHPDVITIGRLDDKREILVYQIRKLKQDVYIMPNEAMQKAYIVEDADTMNINAQNAFLQILEEPPAHAVFILRATNPATLLPTVRSRCVELKVKHVEEQNDISDELDGLAGDFLTSLEGDNVALMRCMFRLEKLERLAFATFLTSAREKLVLSLGDSSNPKLFLDAENVLLKAGDMLNLNVSTGHISGMICASLLRVESRE